MKSLYLPILSFVLIITSCQSVEKLVDKGQYDEAIDLAVRKLKGRKQIKTKHIIALEEGFARITSKDIKNIEFLKQTSSPDKWDKIYKLFTRMEQRQQSLDLLLPIRSNDGYEARFEFVDTYEDKAFAETKAAHYHFTLAQSHFFKFEETLEKEWARRAYREADKAAFYNFDPAKVEDLKKSAYDKGRVHVLVQLGDENEPFFPDEFTLPFYSGFENRYDAFWVVYHHRFVDGLAFDAVAQIKIEEILISPEREEIVLKERTLAYQDVVEVEVIRDSIATIEEEVRDLKTQLEIRSITRSKILNVRAVFELLDFTTGDLIEYVDITVDEEFVSKGSTERLRDFNVPDSIRSKYPKRRGGLLPFPTDYEMMDIAREQLIRKFIRLVQDQRLT